MIWHVQLKMQTRVPTALTLVAHHLERQACAVIWPKDRDTHHIAIPVDRLQRAAALCIAGAMVPLYAYGFDPRLRCGC